MKRFEGHYYVRPLRPAKGDRQLRCEYRSAPDEPPCKQPADHPIHLRPKGRPR